MLRLHNRQLTSSGHSVSELFSNLTRQYCNLLTVCCRRVHGCKVITPERRIRSSFCAQRRRAPLDNIFSSSFPAALGRRTRTADGGRSGRDRPPHGPMSVVSRFIGPRGARPRRRAAGPGRSSPGPPVINGVAATNADGRAQLPD